MNEQVKKILVVGPGAVGCLVGAHLARAGMKVHFRHPDPARERALEESGISVSGLAGFHVPAYRSSRLRSAPDLVIMAVKAHQVENAVEGLKRKWLKAAPVLFLSNGMGFSSMPGTMLPGSRRLVGLNYHGALLSGPGRVRHTGAGKIQVGGPAPSAKPVVDILNLGGLNAEVRTDILKAQWTKLAINAMINPLTALLEVANGKMPGIRGCHRIMNDVAAECVMAAREDSVMLDGGKLVSQCIAVCRNTAKNRSSMLSDLDQCRGTEIGFINGYVVEKLKACKKTAPACDLLLKLVKAKESLVSA